MIRRMLTSNECTIGITPENQNDMLVNVYDGRFGFGLDERNGSAGFLGAILLGARVGFLTS